MKIPRYDSRQEPTTQPAGVERTPSRVGESISKLGNVAFKIGSQIQKAENTRLEAMYEDRIYQATTEIETKASQDTNMDGTWSDRYNTELQNSVKGILEEAPADVRGEVSRYANKQMIKTKARLAKEHYQKAQDNYDIVKKRKKEKTIDEYLAAQTQAAREDALLEYRENLEKGLEAGYIYPEEYKKELEDLPDEIEEARKDRDLYNDPEGFKEKAEQGAYTFEDNEEKEEKIEEAERLIKSREKREKAEEHRTHTEGANKLSQALLQNTLTVPMVNKMYKANIVDEDTAAIYASAASGAYDVEEPTDENKAMEVDYLLTLLENTIEENADPLSIMKKATKAVDEKDMTTDQYAYFVQEANKIAGGGRATSAWQKINAFVRRWGAGVVPSIMIRKYLERAQGDAIPEEVSQEIMDETWEEQYPGLLEEGYTKEDIEYTAKKHNMTIAQVVGFLRKPEIQNPDGSISTERSITIEADGRFYNIPTIIEGKQVSEQEAIEHFRETGESLGVYDTQDEAVKQAKQRSEMIGQVSR